MMVHLQEEVVHNLASDSELVGLCAFIIVFIKESNREAFISPSGKISFEG
jgi:hypothetical protein